ncbi:MAG: RNA polymerase subunit sigma-24, partial [bacterium]|nr:RNA polymerase subunit sigma-24 [bacterium]
TRLEAGDPQQVRVVELHYFGGMSIPETASALGISTSTVDRDWSMAKAWIRRELSRGAKA